VSSKELLIELVDSITAFYRKFPDGESPDINDPAFKRYLSALDESIAHVEKLKVRYNG